MHIDPSVFKACDIRGVVGKTIDEEFAEHLGRAFGFEALAHGDGAFVAEVAPALSRHFAEQGRWAEGLALFESAERLFEPAEAPERAALAALMRVRALLLFRDGAGNNTV